MLPTHSQNISRGEVKTIINEQGETLVIMHLEDAKPILMDILDYEIVDSLLTAYKEKDTIRGNIIELQLSMIESLQEKSKNKDKQIENLNKIIKNKDGEIALKEKTIKQQKKEIRKQKRLKTLGFMGCIIIPIITVILIL